jgi:hypothetical protein
VILGLLMAQGFALASEPPRFANSNPEPLASADGHVLVSTNKLRYTIGETIVVQVANTLDTAITTRDQRFQCTIIALERRRERDGEWSEVRNCFSGAPVSEVTLEPGASTTIRLESGSNPLGGLEPGLYRAALYYSRGDRLSLASGKLLVAKSEQFRLE